ncbi:hypothetical protein JTB14_012493 [Gonioctena quinquepunctata]|nr:hypothetical protein JTB14_012493 [Gonioctena quinquepunctata]
MDEIESEGCIEFLSIESFAGKFIDGIILEATDSLEAESSLEPEKDVCAKGSECYGDYFTFIDEKKKEFSSWPFIAEFTIELGASKIDEFLMSFQLKEEWLYAIYFLRTTSDPVSVFFEYETIWSLPSAAYPIAQVTASVFFIMEVSKVIPKNCPVKVHYFLETNSFKQNAEYSTFSEMWLKNILDAKLKFFKRVKF